MDRFNKKKDKDSLEFYNRLKQLLDERKWVKDQVWTSSEAVLLNKLLFYTAKPVIYLVNISEQNFLQKKNKWLGKINEWA